MSGNNPKKVERITPSAQSEIDKKSYRALDQDFATGELSSRLVFAERTERTPEKKRRIGDKVRYFDEDAFLDLPGAQGVTIFRLSFCNYFKLLIFIIQTFRS